MRPDMDDVILIAETHEYVTTDGLKLPSVSDITSLVSNLIYKSIDPEVVAMAAMRGSAIHGYTVELDDKNVVECPKELSGYLQAYVNACNEHDMRWFKNYTEQAMRYGKEYAGTIDRFGDVDGKKTLVDIKTNSRITKQNLVAYETQLNLYRWMLEAHEEKVEQLLILHLKKDGKYKLIEIPISDELATACLMIYKRMFPTK